MQLLCLKHSKNLYEYNHEHFPLFIFLFRVGGSLKLAF